MQECLKATQRMRSLEWVGWIITDLCTTLNTQLFPQGCKNDVVEGPAYSDTGVEAEREEET